MAVYAAPYVAAVVMLYGSFSASVVQGKEFLVCLLFHSIVITPILLVYNLFVFIYIKTLSAIMQRTH